MTWGRMYDKWHKERDVNALRHQGRRGLQALGLWAWFWSWALDDPRLDGFIPKEELRRGDLPAARLLVERGLWREINGGYVIAAPSGAIPSVESLAHKREADRTRIAEKRATDREPVACDTEATRSRLAPPDLDPDLDPDSDQTPSLGPDLDLVAPAPAPPSLREREEGEAPKGTQKPASAPEDGALCPPPDAESGGVVVGRHAAAARAAWAELDLVLPTAPVANTNGSERGSGVMRRPAPDEDPYEVAQAVWIRFQAKYEERFGYLPYMRASNAGDFGARVASLARALNEPVMQLFDRGFDAWCQSPAKEDAGRRAPYANFVLRFESLVARRAAGAGLSPKDLLTREISAALARGDHAAYEILNERYCAQYLGGQRARPAAG